MDNKSAKADELTRKVNYVRDWLNKAEDAIRRGDTIEAVTKLSLAKADTTNLISILIPITRQLTQPRPAFAPAHFVRKMAMMSAPFLFIGCFLIGLAVGGNNPRNAQVQVNDIPARNVAYSLDRQIPENDKVAVADTQAADTNAAPPVVYTASKPRVNRVPQPTPVTPAEISPVAPEPVVEPAPDTADVDEHIDLFGFSIDVIRSARENMGS